MRRAGSWPARRGAGIFEEIIGPIPAVVGECACGIAVSEDHRVVVSDRFGWRQPPAWILKPRLQPRERLRDGLIGDRPSLRIVGVEEFGPRRPVDNSVELP